MTPPTQPRRLRFPPWLTVTIIITVFCGSILGCIIGVTGFFRLSSETTALRASFMKSVPGVWDTKIALRVGWFTTGVARIGARVFDLPSEPRAALAALHGAEVGIYQLGRKAETLEPQAALKTVDDAMRRQGWDRIVGVAEGQDLVAVYFPRRKVSPRGAKCCVLVFQGRELIVGSLRGNLEPLMTLGSKHFAFIPVEPAGENRLSTLRTPFARVAPCW